MVTPNTSGLFTLFSFHLLVKLIYLINLSVFSMIQSLSSRQLDAFFAVATHTSFTLAAKKLCISQSALSLRIINLEQRLEATLFIREPSGIRLTELGVQLLHYCKAKTALEEEFLSQCHTKSTQLTGTIRIASFSTVTKSIVLPQVSKLLQTHVNVCLDLTVLEIRDLLPALEKAMVDFILLNKKIDKKDITCELIGYENYVMVKCQDYEVEKNTFIDHDYHDTTTAQFLSMQKSQQKKWKSHYLDDIYLVIEGVKQGLGCAIVPEHLIKNDDKLVIVKGFKAMQTPIYLAYFNNAYPSKLHNQVLNTLRETLTAVPDNNRLF
jgi:DNA-binding transcriptional LysR family regulator